jgi:hypothetical protein
MKLYTDAFKKPITKTDVMTAVKLMIDTKRADVFLFSRRMGWGYAKASAVIRLFEDADVISIRHRNKHTILLRDVDMANNAALRQLRKGNG